MDYVRSNKGGMKLLFQNNLYVQQKVLSSGADCWECDQCRNNFACKAKLHVLDDQVIKQVNDHTHVASRAVVESSKVRQEMKKRAKEPSTRASTSSISRQQPTNKEYRPRLPQQGRLQYLCGLAHNISM